jgi:hypothetical protein
MRTQEARRLAAIVVLGLLTFASAGCAAIGGVTGGGIYMNQAPTSVARPAHGTRSSSRTHPAQP